MLKNTCVEDDFGQMLHEAEEVCETEKELRDPKRMLEDYRILLYTDCKQDHKKSGTTLELLQWKALNGLSKKGFEELLKLIKNLLPEGNTLLETTMGKSWSTHTSFIFLNKY